MNDTIHNKLADLFAELSTVYRTQSTSSSAERVSFDDVVGSCRAFLWNATAGELEPVDQVDAIPYQLLHGVEPQRETILQNTRQFADGFPANNILLWGARGTGKSSCVKAVHQQVLRENSKRALLLVQILRSDLQDLPRLLDIVHACTYRVILFCDDLVFHGVEDDFKFLKVVLDGGLKGRPENVVFYATSNRRHIVAREAIEQEQASALMPHETVEEKVALSDRFGLWVGFHPMTQDVFEEIAASYAEHYGLPLQEAEVRRRARVWALERGGRSGRVAWQFIQDLAGRLGVKLS